MTPHPPRKPGPGQRTLATVEFDGVLVDLDRRSGRHFLRGGDGADQELSDTEARQLRLASEDFQARAEAVGLCVDRSDTARHARLAELRAARPTDLAVLVDTTTMVNAERALYSSGAGPSALGLLDLSALTAAAVLFDTIVVQPQGTFVPFGRLDNVRRVLPPSYDTNVELRQIHDEVWQSFNQPPQLADYRERWGTFLNLSVDEVHLDMAAVRSLDSEPMSGHVEFAADVLAAVGTRTKHSRKRDDLAIALAIQTIRAGFNDAVAGALGVPYLATSIRLPVSSRLARSKTDVLWLLRELIARSSPKGEYCEPKPFETQVKVAAPLILGLVMERMGTPDDYPAALDEIRDRFLPLRRELTEARDSAAWERKPQLYLERFTKHMAGLGAKAGATQGVVAAAAQAGVTLGTGDPGITTVALKVIGATKPAELAHRAYLRLWRPEICVLLNAAAESRRLSLLSERIRSIWGRALDPVQQLQLERLSGSLTDPFLEPIRLA